MLTQLLIFVSKAKLLNTINVVKESLKGVIKLFQTGGNSVPGGTIINSSLTNPRFGDNREPAHVHSRLTLKY